MKHYSGIQPLLWILLVLIAAVGLLIYDINLLTYVIVGIAILLLAFALFVIFYSGYWVMRNRMSRIVRVQARVVRRRTKDWDVSLMGTSRIARLSLMGRQRDEAWKAYSRRMARGDVSELDIAAGTNYFVTFDVNGQENEFSVPEDYYVKCSEGAEGLLVYQGEEFMRFVPDVHQGPASFPIS